MIEVHVNDSVPIEVSWFIPSPTNPYQEDDAVISEAEVTIIRNHDRQLVVDRQAATISGNETSYILPSELNVLKGQHTAWVSATFNDDNRMTKEIEFYVK